MDLFLLIQGLVLGIVEGVTEFIPVSSTGHLILAGDLIRFNGERAKVFEIVIQLGAILAVLWLYRAKIFGSLAGVTRDRRAQSFFLNLFIAFLPAAFVGLLTHKAITRYLFNPVTVAAALIVGGIAILLIERMRLANAVRDVDDISLRQAFQVGLAQCLALFPGISRSGATIMGGLVIGLDRRVSVEFSFFLAIPTMIAATGYELVSNLHALSAADIPLFAVGFLTAFVSALFVVKAFIGFVSRSDFRGFAWYRIGFGLLVLAFYGFRGWTF